MMQALLLIGLGICLPAAFNVLFDWRRNKRMDRWMQERRYLPTCAIAGSVRPARPGRPS